MEASMSLLNFCHKPVVKISPQNSILEACQMLKENNVGCLVVESQGKLCGILTDRDIALKVTGEEKEPRTTRVAEVMTRDPIRISVDKDLRQLTSLMHTFNVRRIPVVDGYDTIVGIITLDDLIALLGEEMSEIGKAVSEEFPELQV
jgi:CBS domain-containing protein